MQVKQKPSLHASWIDPDAADIVARLQRAGFAAYLVGGCVRDLLAGIHPKDFDIATSALPNEVRRKVYGAYVIGKRFRLVLVKRGSQQYEVATFRREGRPEDFAAVEEGDEAPVGDNFFGTPEEDAIRRDFTINALFYDPVKNELIDYANGMADITSQIVRMIGDPQKRIREDAIRALRALRLSHKLSFKIEESLRAAMIAEGPMVAMTAMPRRREEFIKILRLPEPARAFLELYDLGYLKLLLPTLHAAFEQPGMLEIFLDYMFRWPEMVKDSSQPTELYTAFAWSFIAANAGENLAEWRIDEATDRLLRNELGAFKAEMAAIESTFKLQRQLHEVDSFKRRGLRRQQSFLRSSDLDRALRFSRVDYLLPSSQQGFWEQSLQHEAKQ